MESWQATVDIPPKSVSAVRLVFENEEEYASNRRLLGSIGNVPPAEFEALYAEQRGGPTAAVGLR